MEHEDIPPGEIHVLHNWAYANAAARAAAVISDAALLHRWALQLDDGTYWRLSDVSPTTWAPVVSGTGEGGEGAPLTSEAIIAALTYVPANAAVLTNVENKSSATIRGELTGANVEAALTYTPADAADLSAVENKSSATIRSELTSANVVAALAYTPVNPSIIGAANGLVPLDSGVLIPAIYLPSYVDDVIESATVAALPATGVTGKIYVITTGADINKQYRWSGSAYAQMVASPGTTDDVPEGALTTRQYFSEARVRAAVLTGLSTATNIAIVAADTVLGALGKLQKQISDLILVVATKTGAETLTNKTLTTPILESPIEKVQALGSISGNVAINLSLGSYVTATIAGATTFSFTNPAATGFVSCITLELVNPSTNVTWPAGAKWPGGAAPTFTVAGTDIITAHTRDGGATHRMGLAHKDTK